MESKALYSISKATGAMENPKNEMAAAGKEKKAEGYVGKDIGLEKNYDAISKNGDTLELSEKGKKMGACLNMEVEFPDSGKKISDSVLTGYSEAKLKQLYVNKEITKQQYERIIKKKKAV